jgi:hypothetical protein
MSQRDRLIATVIIWSVFIFLTIAMLDRVLMLRADFSGLWPDNSGMFSDYMAQEAEDLRQMLDSAREASPAILAQVQEDIRVQLATRMPVALGISVLLMLAAVASTFFVWRNAGVEAYLAREAVQAEKVKRRSRIEQFMDDLDADEMAQLRSRLTDEQQARLQ